MKKHLILLLAICLLQVASAQQVSRNASAHQVEVSLDNSSKHYYNVKSLSAIDIANGSVTFNGDKGQQAYSGNLSSIGFLKAAKPLSGVFTNAAGHVAITEACAWHESAYVKFSLLEGATTYHIYIKGEGDYGYVRLDSQLVRNYGTYGRADAVGLASGKHYAMRIVPVDEKGREMADAANEATQLPVVAYDRSGFAHKDREEGVGAYNNDGTLKADARVVYVTKATAKTVSLDVTTSAKGTLTTYTGLQAIINGYQKGYETRPLAVRLIGMITESDTDELLSSEEGLQIKGRNGYSPLNITIEGIGDDATVKGFGFLIRNAASVELRNFANMLCRDDAVSIDTKNENIWVHHLDLFYGKPGKDADQVKGDGTIDLKGDSRYVTIAYNHLWDSGKASLCGMSSETGPNWITYHHNWFDHSDSRHPRIRTMSVHVYNNYFDGNSKYGVGAAMQSNAFVEANYFRNCKYPMLISMQGSDVATDPDGTFSGEDGGMIKAYANTIVGATRYVTYQDNTAEFDAYEVSTRSDVVPAKVKAKKGGRIYDNWDVDPDIMYDYTPDSSDDVPEVVTGWLGAGRMGHGDFQWTFDNAVEDKNYAPIAELKSAIQDYRPSLLGIFGSEDEGQEPGGGNVDPGTHQPIEGTVFCWFDKSGNPSSDLFEVINGNGSNSKGSVTIDGVTYSTCLKIESETQVKFTTTQPMIITLYFDAGKTASILIDGVAIVGNGDTYSTRLEAGEHMLTKDKSINLFGIKLEPVSQQ